MKALIIISQNNFRDEELFVTKKILEKNKIRVDVGAPELKECSGMLGGKIMPDVLLKGIDCKNYDAVIFAGGSGALKYFNDESALSLAKDAFISCKVLGAICVAPGILANAGLLKGKNAAAFESVKDLLKKKGANNLDKGVVVDGKIITSNGPLLSEEFANEIVKSLIK